MLGEDGSETTRTGISLQYKPSTEVWAGEYGRGSQCLLELLERVFFRGSPGPLRVLSGEARKGCGDRGETGDESAVPGSHP